MNKLTMLLILPLLGFTSGYAAQVTATIYATNDDKKPVGQIVFSDTPYGLLVSPNLTTLPAGQHGFHLHQHPDCGDHGAQAGGHFDPQNTNSHQGPYGQGHLGDLAALYVDATGKASTPTLAPRIKTTDLKGLTVMIHAGGDNYTNNPPLGGGGARIACGVVQ